MAGIATLGIDDSLFTLRVEWLYTLARLLNHPHAKAFAPEFQAIGPILDAAIKTQGTLDDAAVMAAAARDSADEGLDPIMVQVLATILLITRGDRSDALYLSYAGSQTAAEVVKPVLGPELVMAKDWIEALSDPETDTALQAFTQPLTAAVQAGTDAENGVKASDKALSDFRLNGERKKVVDALNAARGALYGKLVQFQHDHPELRLGAGWAARFFRRSSKSARFGTTVAQVEQAIAKLEAERADAVAVLADLQQKAAEYETAKANREKARADLAELRKAQKAQKAQEKALKAEANKKLKK